jgi:nucleotide-binding universal stress UspA family protein
MDRAGTGRVVVGVANTIAGYEALRFAVETARERRAPLVALRAVRAPVAADAWPELRRTLHDAARADIAKAFDEALGGMPRDVDVSVRTRSGLPDHVLAMTADRPDDLLVLGAAEHQAWPPLGHGHVARHCTRAAACPVVVVPARAMARSGTVARLGRSVVYDIESFLHRAG